MLTSLIKFVSGDKSHVTVYNCNQIRKIELNKKEHKLNIYIDDGYVYVRTSDQEDFSNDEALYYFDRYFGVDETKDYKELKEAGAFNIIEETYERRYSLDPHFEENTEAEK